MIVPQAKNIKFKKAFLPYTTVIFNFALSLFPNFGFVSYIYFSKIFDFCKDLNPKHNKALAPLNKDLVFGH